MRWLFCVLPALAACPGEREDPKPPPAARPVAKLTCEGLLPSSKAAAILGHKIRYRQTRHRNGPYEAISCENRSHYPKQVFAFDVGCGIGARERFVSAIRSVRNAIKQTEPKVGDVAWASENVYLSWYSRTSCHTAVLISWLRPHPDRLRNLAAIVKSHLP